ncbi:MAG: DUF3168 domain-containing protein [Azonexus sp.]
MSIEADLKQLLVAINPNTWPDVAPSGAATPYLTWQQLGGASVRYGDNTADSRWPLIQINAWAKTRLEAITLIRQVEDALCASSAFQAEPQGEPVSTYEPDTKLYGSIQRFEVFGAR